MASSIGMPALKAVTSPREQEGHELQIPTPLLWFHARKIRPEEESKGTAGGDASPAHGQRGALQAAVVVLPQDVNPFTLLQLQLIRAVHHMGVESRAAVETRGRGGALSLCPVPAALPAVWGFVLWALHARESTCSPAQLMGCCCYCRDNSQGRACLQGSTRGDMNKRRAKRTEEK